MAAYRPGSPPQFGGPWAIKDGTSDLAVRATQRGIVEHFTAECARVYGDHVTVTHGMRAVGGRVCEGEVVLEDPAGERVTRRFDVVIGADGYMSSVRDLMQEQVRPCFAMMHAACMSTMHDNIITLCGSCQLYRSRLAAACCLLPAAQPPHDFPDLVHTPNEFPDRVFGSPNE